MTRKAVAEAEAEAAMAGMAPVRALVPLWAADAVVTPGTIFDLPADVAADLAARGLVARVEGGEREVG